MTNLNRETLSREYGCGSCEGSPSYDPPRTLGHYQPASAAEIVAGSRKRSQAPFATTVRLEGSDAEGGDKIRRLTSTLAKLPDAPDIPTVELACLFVSMLLCSTVADILASQFHPAEHVQNTHGTQTLLRRPRMSPAYVKTLPTIWINFREAEIVSVPVEQELLNKWREPKNYHVAPQNATTPQLAAQTDCWCMTSSLPE